MGSAILSGLLKAGFEASQVTVSTRTQASALNLSDTLGVNAIALETDELANRLAVKNADVVLVAVKPVYVTEVLAEVANDLNPQALIISVAAGITTTAMQARVPETVSVIRSMPNTPAIVGRAVTGIAPGERATAEQIVTATELFETVGKVILVEESMIDALGTVSGSGPAYVFYLIEEFTKAAEKLGFNHQDAALMVGETFLGAAELLAASGKNPADLRRQVTSPNGTTMQAIARMQKTDLEGMFVEATEAALARSHEIAAGTL